MLKAIRLVALTLTRRMTHIRTRTLIHTHTHTHTLTLTLTLTLTIRLVAPLLRVRLSERGSHLLSPLVQVAHAPT